MAPQNRAAWLKEKQAPVMVVDDAPYSPPGPDEIVVKAKAVAINPADWKLQQWGILIESYPSILGLDVAGIIEEVGSNVPYQKGDHVIGQSDPRIDHKYSGFQDYVVLKAGFFGKIPKDVPFSDGAVLPIGLTTAASCLFVDSMLDLTMPPGKGNGTLLVWGASSSVGSCGVQLAVAAGYEVIGVASKRNHETVKSLGATVCFDQSSPTVVDDVVAALKGKCVGAYDGISEKDTVTKVCEILSKSGASKVAAVQPGVEEYSTADVKVVTNFAAIESYIKNGIGSKTWKYLESALEAGTFQYKPTAEIVGHGLENIQKACDLLAKGVSAKKLVVTLD